ncbi:hypothetical protein [Arcticibacter eurypsychrophilus]|uniref:hypothetical protein n=1 Tax=Arcticibacter eurypsychrophilus TaxID=1434752 RepID=UPI00084D3EC1|nr:hypothetical protein [Arcticibacter eurypsychrophilus]
MKRIIYCLFVFLVVATVFSCKKDRNTRECVEVKYVMDYCPTTGAALLRLVNPNSDSFTDERGNVVSEVAFLNVPDSFKVKDKVFFVSYHYDAALDKPDVKPCPAIFGPAKIFVIDSVSEIECKD